MKQVVSIADAKNKFTALVREVEADTVVEVTRRGKPVMVMLSIEAYEALSQPQPSFGDALTHFLTTTDREGIDPDLIFARDPSPGREVTF